MAAGHSYWPVRPLNPTGFGDSPYQGFSACAGNHYGFVVSSKTNLLRKAFPAEKVEPILAALRPLFSTHSGVMFVADVSVSRRDYFGEADEPPR